jgi:hypothetical protein
MTWFHWLVVALWIIEIAAHIATIDEPRKPRDKGGAIAVLLLNGLLIWGMVHFT